MAKETYTVLLADDSEMYERCHRGVLVRSPDGLLIELVEKTS